MPRTCTKVGRVRATFALETRSTFVNRIIYDAVETIDRRCRPYYTLAPNATGSLSAGAAQAGRSAYTQTTYSTIQETTMNTSARLPLILAITIFGALTFGGGTLSFATDRFDASQVKVRYGDLDVSSASGAAALYKRIQGAAETVCHQWEHGDLYYRNLFYTCMQKTMNNAINALNQPVLLTIAANAGVNAKAGLVTAKVIVTSNGK